MILSPTPLEPPALSPVGAGGTGVAGAGRWDQMAHSGTSRPSEEKNILLSLSVKIREQVEMKSWSCVQGQRRRAEEGQCYFCLAHRW